MLVYHATRYNNVIQIMNNKFKGSLPTIETDGFTTLTEKKGVVFVGKDLGFIKENYAMMDDSCIIAIEINEKYVNSIKEIKDFNECYPWTEEEFYIDVDDLNNNMDIIGYYNKNMRMI